MRTMSDEITTRFWRKMGCEPHPEIVVKEVGE
jgi:hypothetical protein